jgi:L-lactate dehydrogenase complex protein LldF
MRETPYLRHPHHEFLQAAQTALGDPELHRVLGQLHGTLALRNRQAWAALTRSDEIRQRARAIKDQTLAELDRHLETLARNVERRGGKVHWAADGAEACRIITELLRARGARMVVKSKSMTSEEIHLNEALAAAGIEAVETDLGEYIIQLAGHRPSHIVAPAIHLTLSDIAAILSRAAGRPLPVDRTQLAQFARQTLREKFAQADAGITGVNFAIAQTGSLVLVTNEGNGRLTCTLPRCQIALMGIEKVIPRWEDLGCFLKVLARGATGQKLSVYTQILSGPRRPGEHEGPQELHLVLLDNGRTRILGSPLRESLFCIRCGACLNACPIYRHVGGHAYGGVYAGPIGAVLTPLYDGLVPNQHLPHASSLCGACQAACPVKIQIPELLIRLRDALHHTPGGSSRLEHWAYRLWAATLRRPWLYRLSTWLVARTLGRWKAKAGWLRRLPGGLAGWTSVRDFPAPAPQRFRDWWRSEEAQHPASAAASHEPQGGRP